MIRKHIYGSFYSTHTFHDKVLGSDLVIPQEKITKDNLEIFINNSFKYYFFDKNLYFEINKFLLAGSNIFEKLGGSQASKVLEKSLFDKGPFKGKPVSFDKTLCFFPTYAHFERKEYLVQSVGYVIDVTNWYKKVEHLVEPQVFLDLLKQMHWSHYKNMYEDRLWNLFFVTDRLPKKFPILLERWIPTGLWHNFIKEFPGFGDNRFHYVSLQIPLIDPKVSSGIFFPFSLYRCSDDLPLCSTPCKCNFNWTTHMEDFSRYLFPMHSGYGKRTTNVNTHYRYMPLPKKGNTKRTTKAIIAAEREKSRRASEDFQKLLGFIHWLENYKGKK